MIARVCMNVKKDGEKMRKCELIQKSKCSMMRTELQNLRKVTWTDDERKVNNARNQNKDFRKKKMVV